MSEAAVSEAATNVVSLFEAAAGTYDESRRRLVPCFDDFYGTAVTVATPPLHAALAAGRTPAVLDLGAGTGLLALLLGVSVPAARVTLLDAAPAMLTVAAGHLDARGIGHRLVVADLTDPLPPADGDAPDGRYDAVVTALAVHHLTDPAKRRLYRRAYDLLRPGGVFVNAEQVAGPTPELDRRYAEVWLAQITAGGAEPDEIEAARQRMAYDRPTPVGEQCDWLTEAGFADVDCYFKAWRFAVFGGVRPAG